MGLFRKSRNRRHRRGRRHRATRTLRAEPLERRELLSVNVVGDELHILGTFGDDNVSVAQRSLEQWDERGQRVPVLGPDKYLEVTMNGRTRQIAYDFPGGPDIYKIVFRGYSGDDTFHNYTDIGSEAYGGLGRDTLYGGSGCDLLVGGSGVDHLYGGRGRDTLCADQPPGSWTTATTSFAAADPDCEEVSDPIVDANPQCNTISGQVYCVDTLGHVDAVVHDYLYGGPDNDTLYGGPYNDRMWGDEGADELFGRGGDDHLYGGEGIDTLHGGPGADLLAGEDDPDYLYGDEGDDRLFGGEGGDTLEGGKGDDALLGEGGADTLRGGPDNDHLMGGAGSDVLYGGEGSDGLFGGADAVRDVLWGDEPGSGVWAADRFLTRAGDVRADFCPADVEIGMPDECDPRVWESGTEPWTDREVYWLDRAFGQLQERAGSTGILKDVHGNGPIEFVKTFQSQWNEFADDAGRWHTVILIDDWTEDLWLEEDRSTNRKMQRITIHEVGHGWDGNHECGVPPRHPDGFEYWAPFAALHDESDRSDPEYDRDFVSDYGKNNADEDWCTCWEMTFGYMRSDYTTDPSERLRQKLAIVDEFFAQFGRRSGEMRSVAVSSLASAAAESDDGDAKATLVAGDLLGKVYGDA